MSINWNEYFERARQELNELGKTESLCSPLMVEKSRELDGIHNIIECEKEMKNRLQEQSANLET